MDQDSRGSHGSLQVAAAADAADEGVQVRAVSENSCEDLLQVGGSQPRGEPQAEHRARASLLQQKAGNRKAGDRNRRGSVGIGARNVERLLGNDVQSLHGRGEFQAKTWDER